jgi:hypothetical protein
LDIKELVAFLRQDGVTHAAMESMAQYWRPVWMALEREFTLTLAQARSASAARPLLGHKPMPGELRSSCCPVI